MTETTRRAKRPRAVDPDGGRAAGSIGAATIQLLERMSLTDISVAQILAEANVSRATFYFYFESKFAVLSGLLEHAMDDVFDTVQPFLARAPQDPPEVALERSIRAVTGVWHRHRLILRATAHHWHSDPGLRALWLSIVDRFITAGAEEIERERAVGKITSPLPGRVLASMLFWGTERVLYIAGSGIETALPDEEAAIAPLVTMWHNTLYG